MSETTSGPNEDGVAPRRRGFFVRAVRFLFKGLLPIAILGGAVAAYANLKATRPEPPKRPQQEKVWVVETLPVRFQSYRPEIRVYGETVAGRTLDIRALVAGEVVETGRGLREGGVVEVGDLLVKLDPFDFEGRLIEARASLSEARARLAELEASLKSERDALTRDEEQLELARRDFERARPLARRGTVSKKTVDDRQTIVTQRTQALEQRRNGLEVWKAKIEQQRAAMKRLEWGVKQAERRLSEVVLRAPFSAYVSNVGAEVGRNIATNDRVANLIDRHWIEAKFTLTNAQYGRLIEKGEELEGRAAEVTWQVGERMIAYEATVERVGATITAAQGGVPVYARLHGPTEPTAIRPGAFVAVALKDKKFEQVARIPQSAIYGGDTVYTVVDGRLAERRVEVVGSIEEDVLVRGELRDGEALIKTRLSAPGPGLKVKTG